MQPISQSTQQFAGDFVRFLTKPVTSKDIGMVDSTINPAVAMANIKLQVKTKTRNLSFSPYLLANMSDILLLVELPIF